MQTLCQSPKIIVFFCLFLFYVDISVCYIEYKEDPVGIFAADATQLSGKVQNHKPGFSRFFLTL
jgi:hypothetical protein